MIRTLRDEVERYGHYSLAAESMYDHPFQWGSKRTGPDLARVGGKYSDGWHHDHLVDPRSVSPASVMPGYPWLAENELDTHDIVASLEVNSLIGVPYTEAMIENAMADLKAQTDPDDGGVDGLTERYPGVQVRIFDGNQRTVTEMDAVIAYLQMLGTLVDFSLYDDQADINLR
jgi:cytochrome c oxidase cbb3-type subunit 2